MRKDPMLWLQKTFESIKNAARAALQNPMQLVSVLGFVLCCVAGVWMWRAGLLGSRAALQAFLEPFGPWAAALFVLFQAVQVVVPICIPRPCSALSSNRELIQAGPQPDSLLTV